MLQSKLNGRYQKTQLVAGIVTRSLKAHGIKWSLFQKRSHGVSNLNLAYGAGTGRSQFHQRCPASARNVQ